MGAISLFDLPRTPLEWPKRAREPKQEQKTPKEPFPARRKPEDSQDDSEGA
jgi:hypothetical protein